MIRQELDVALTPFIPSPEMELTALRNENKELKISLYVLCGLFILILLRASR